MEDCEAEEVEAIRYRTKVIPPLIDPIKGQPDHKKAVSEHGFAVATSMFPKRYLT